MAITTYTTPRTWAEDELVSSAIQNAHVRDNIKHLYEKTSIKFYTDTSSTPETGNGANWASSDCSVSVVVDYVSNITITAACSLKNDAHSDVVPWARIYRDSTGVGQTRGVLQQTDEWKDVSLTALDPDVAAGTYTYAIYHRSNGAGNSVIDDKAIVITVTPIHG